MNRCAVLLAIPGVVALGGCGDSRLKHVEQTVRATMKDPDATLFRNLAYCGDATKGGVVRGEVNGKNSFGAYTGFKSFWSDGVTVETEDDGSTALIERCTAQTREVTLRIRRGLARGYLQDKAAGRTPPYGGNTEAEILANMEAEGAREIDALLNQR